MIAKKITQDTNEYQFYTTEIVKDVNDNDVEILKQDGIYNREQLIGIISNLDSQKAKFQTYLDAIPE